MIVGLLARLAIPPVLALFAWRFFFHSFGPVLDAQEYGYGPLPQWEDVSMFAVNAVIAAVILGLAYVSIEREADYDGDSIIYDMLSGILTILAGVAYVVCVMWTGMVAIMILFLAMSVPTYAFSALVPYLVLISPFVFASIS